MTAVTFLKGDTTRLAHYVVARLKQIWATWGPYQHVIQGNSRSIFSACGRFKFYEHTTIVLLLVSKMGLAVLPPEAEEPDPHVTSHYGVDQHTDSDMSMSDNDGRPSKRPRLRSDGIGQIVLPGELVTDETQWMR